ncbi:MAG: hypothetical protein ACP6IS_10750 [Candidatus Asgardarchaeia archaeon]
MIKSIEKIWDITEMLLFGSSAQDGTNLLNINWDNLIILDACRYDIFKHIYTSFFSSPIEFKYILSIGSSTMEFIRKTFLSISNDIRRKLKEECIFVNANPMIDKTMKYNLKHIFFKYVPVWKNHWDATIGTVKPRDPYYAALRAYINNINKKMVIWFLQPHYPYFDKQFTNINIRTKSFMNRALCSACSSNNLILLLKIFKNLLLKRYLCAGIPSEVCEYFHHNKDSAIRAYMHTLYETLKYVKKLVQVLPGDTVITADHGEAFGERLAKVFPIPVYGHPSRVRTCSLVKVPFLRLYNNISRTKAFRIALKELLNIYHLT